MTFSKSHAIALGLAGAIAVSTAPAFAAPVLSNTATVKESAPVQTTEIQWRRHRGGGSVAAGAAIGFLAGAAIGAAVAPRYYDPYAPGYAYDPGPSYYYAQPAPVYVGPSYAYAPAPMYRAPRYGAGNPGAAFGCMSNGQTGTVGFDPTAC